MPRKRKKSASGNISNHEEDTERYFLDPEAVSRHLFCSICQEVFNEPQRAPCGHSFCKECIFTWLKHKKNCPEDRRPLTRSDLHYDFIVANVIGDHTVACPYRRRGCEFLGKLETLSSHRKSCFFNPNNLPSFLHKDRSVMGEVQPSISGKIDSAPKDVDSLPGPSMSPDTEKLPTPAKPSLAMRLFCKGGGQRDLLCSMFEKEKGAPSTSSSSSSRPVRSNISSAAQPRSRKSSRRRELEDSIIVLDSP